MGLLQFKSLASTSPRASGKRVFVLPSVLLFNNIDGTPNVKPGTNKLCPPTKELLKISKFQYRFEYTTRVRFSTGFIRKK